MRFEGRPNCIIQTKEYMAPYNLAATLKQYVDIELFQRIQDLLLLF
jgi:hypothetical protein